ncbi:DUF1735 and LamG domain-containing protein [Sphingobacterium sp. BIGb0165]|uniref:DUF1735 and LamG domain-containing protein n=1 Tax=Sphingobacterium sp. BIGb0165 TaxID=2940615 RepID=UPI00216A5158|nr:DUF1735 and LamG domain-containing protein [Sphingobacterium sp. BIGb0165]MCS4226359.1 hypothetical protein [Sphingobacterium sp. BIGb0165]
MKKYWIKKIPFVLFGLLCCLLAGCRKSAVEQRGIYITRAQVNPFVGLSVDNTGGSLSVTASASAVVNQDLDVVFRINPALVDSYNAQNGTDFKALPAQLIRLSATQAAIRRGSNVSDAIQVEILPLAGAVEVGTQYLVPIEVASVSSNDFPILESSKVLYAQIQQVLVNPALDLSQANGVSFAIPDPISNLNAFTVEMRVRVTRGPFRNNMTLFAAYPDEIYSRFGDVVISPDQLQIKYKGVQPVSRTRFSVNQWYHIAYVFDGQANSFRIYVNGVEDAATAAPPGSTFNLNQMFFGANGNPIQVQELRFWTQARTGIQLLNNMCAVNPQSDGLYGYWKFDAGQGNTIADATGHGHTGTVNGTPLWVTGIRCPE